MYSYYLRYLVLDTRIGSLNKRFIRKRGVDKERPVFPVATESDKNYNLSSNWF